MAKKVNLKAEAEASTDGMEEMGITDELLMELCPKHLLPKLKKAKTAAARADLLFEIDRGDLKKLRDEYNAMDAFAKKLKSWFVQEFQNEQQGVTGKAARVEIKTKETAQVEDWTAFYAGIKKTNSFDLLNKAVNQKAVAERWEQGKKVAGVRSFTVRSVSLTSVKGK